MSLTAQKKESIRRVVQEPLPDAITCRFIQMLLSIRINPMADLVSQEGGNYRTIIERAERERDELLRPRLLKVLQLLIASCIATLEAHAPNKPLADMLRAYCNSNFEGVTTEAVKRVLTAILQGEHQLEHVKLTEEVKNWNTALILLIAIATHFPTMSQAQEPLEK